MSSGVEVDNAEYEVSSLNVNLKSGTTFRSLSHRLGKTAQFGTARWQGKAVLLRHLDMAKEPQNKRAVAFFDGQNVYHAAKRAFGHTFPNYDPVKLAQHACDKSGWELAQVRFYTGVPDAGDKPFWNHFWVAKGAQMGRDGVVLFTRRLMYRNKTVRLPDGTKYSFLAGDEKGIDARIAIDVIGGAHREEFDVALIFSQDQDLSEAADEVRTISIEQNRWIKVACAYPVSPTVKARGINNTQWVTIERADYDLCLDPRDYRPKPPGDSQSPATVL